MTSFPSASDKIQAFIHLEYYIILTIVLFFGLGFYKFHLTQITEKRHKNLQARFRSTFYLLLVSFLFSLANRFYLSLEMGQSGWIQRIYTVFLYLTISLSAVTFVKVAQILAYLYLFFKNKSVGIPRLLANLFTFIFSLIVFIYLMSEVFSINLTAMLATSAVFSIVLGLALQDTLGNLFSGVALQIGNPFTIGDWVEIQNAGNKWTGQVQEITWRATFINTFSNEWIMIPNKIMAQSQILIYSNNVKQVRHSHTFRIDFSADIRKIKALLLESMLKNPDVGKDPAPRVLIIETTESWLTVKVFYSIEDFSRKYSIGDEVIQDIMSTLQNSGVPLAMNKISFARIPE